jgi:hypothetical protein
MSGVPSEGTHLAPGTGVSDAGVRASGRRRWGAAVALGAAVLFFGVADGFPLVALPLAVLMIGMSGPLHWKALGVVILVWALILVPGGSGLNMVSRGWGLLLGGAFLVATLLRSQWSALSRSLTAVAACGAVAALGFLVSGGWAGFDRTMAEHFRTMAGFSSRELLARFPDAVWSANFAAMAESIAATQATVFPALLALQSLAALALGWWAFAGSRSASAPALRPLREFRFNDALVWLVIGGLVAVLLPLGEGAVRTGYNVLLFMCALYVLRGIAVFVFLARGAPTATSVVLGALATVFFYPIVFTAALLVGLGDTWLDVRGRVMAAASRV